MSRGGAREGAGRPAGSVTRRSAEAVAQALAEGITPIEYMLGIMRNADADPKERAWAAEKVAPYVHPRPAPLERTVQIELPDTSTPDGIGHALDAILQAIGKGELPPAEGGQPYFGDRDPAEGYRDRRSARPHRGTRESASAVINTKA